MGRGRPEASEPSARTAQWDWSTRPDMGSLFLAAWSLPAPRPLGQNGENRVVSRYFSEGRQAELRWAVPWLLTQSLFYKAGIVG